MRILHVLDHSIPIHSGYSFRTRAILEQQKAIGLETFSVTSAKHQGSDAAIEDVGEFRFFRTPQPRGWYSRLPLIKQLAVIQTLIERVDEVIKEVQPDIIHAHSPALNGLAALRVAKRHGLPVVYECRAFWEDAAVDHGTSREGGPRYHGTRALETYVFQQAHAITTICEGLRRDIIKRGIPTEKVTVIPNSVDIRRFTVIAEPDCQLRSKLGLDGKIVLGFIGSFYAYEGISLLLKSFGRILTTHPDVRLLLVGGGPEEAVLNDVARDLGIADKIIFAGRIPHEHILSYYSQIDLLVYPRHSMRLTELVTPLKPLEAMALGRIVVASDVGGHRELIRDGQTGWLFPADDVGGLADALNALLGRRQSWQGVQQAARQFVESERTWEISVERYVDIYTKLRIGRQDS